LAKISELSKEKINTLIPKYKKMLLASPDDESVRKKYNALLKRQKALRTKSTTSKPPSLNSEQKQDNDHSQYQDATFLQRAVAIIIDFIVLNIFSQILIFVLRMIIPGGSSAGSIEGIFLQSGIAMLASMFICPYIYYVIPIEKTGQSFGKKVMKIKIITTEAGETLDKRKIIFREFLGKMLSTLAFGIGFFVVLADRKAWHDRIAKTKVIALE
jgi:uncharacterized RDD family membrane protein YckC